MENQLPSSTHKDQQSRIGPETFQIARDLVPMPAAAIEKPPVSTFKVSPSATAKSAPPLLSGPRNLSDFPISDKDHSGMERKSVLLQFVGVVVHVGAQNFTARLSDPRKQRPDSDAEIPIKAVKIEQKDLIKKGATFYWTVFINAQKETVTALQFRRLPEFQPRDQRRVEEYLKLLSEEDDK